MDDLTICPCQRQSDACYMQEVSPEIKNYMCYGCGGQLTPVHPSVVNDWIVKEGQWFSVDQGQVGYYLKDVFENYKNYTDKAKRQAFKSKNEFSWDKMKEKIDEVLTKYVPEFPRQVELNSPQLKKVVSPLS